NLTKANLRKCRGAMKEAVDLVGLDLNKTVNGLLYISHGSNSNCDYNDKSTCTKKGNGYDVTLVETQKSTVETIVMEVSAAKNDGKCKCGANCSCTSCTCGY
nr:metallothionein-like protein type 3 [Tanacetum cinerariifolium]